MTLPTKPDQEYRQLSRQTSGAANDTHILQQLYFLIEEQHVHRLRINACSTAIAAARLAKSGTTFVPRTSNSTPNVGFALYLQYLVHHLLQLSQDQEPNPDLCPFVNPVSGQ
jgi:hypothetical protein